MANVNDPRTLIGSAVYVEGDRYIGVIEDVQLPDIDFGTIESGTGVKRETPVPILEAMKATIKISGEDKAVYKATARQLSDMTTITIRNDVTTVRHDSVDVTLGGRVKVLKAPTLKAGEKVETELEMHLDLYVYQVNGVKRVEIDAKNIICVIDGVDLFAETRANL